MTAEVKTVQNITRTFKYSFPTCTNEEVLFKLEVPVEIPHDGSTRELVQRIISMFRIPVYLEDELNDKLAKFVAEETKANNSNPFRCNSRFPLILKIKELLYECHNTGINIILAWIPGHSGIPGNEVADSCAKAAAQIGTSEHMNSYSHDLCLIPKADLQESWTNAWNISKNIKGKFYADIQSEIPHLPWFFKFREANKSTTSSVCRLRLGHACTPVFLAKLRIRNHSMCECGLDEGNINHIFFNCPQLRCSLYDILPSEIFRPTTMKNVLALSFDPVVIYTLCKFITVNNLKL